jgi:hypothetical protein
VAWHLLVFVPKPEFAFGLKPIVPISAGLAATALIQSVGATPDGVVGDRWCSILGNRGR